MWRRSKGILDRAQAGVSRHILQEDGDEGDKLGFGEFAHSHHEFGMLAAARGVLGRRDAIGAIADAHRSRFAGDERGVELGISPMTRFPRNYMAAFPDRQRT